ncbi:hypothetical protein WN944_001671 [Citrus x changshan-huyou]|uniref:Uncharacterized protein n=1 Tax=Citrus x changshan-huyou TaxID=2935761 RepID=A0AAP0QRF6_9ROSI
MSRSVCKTIYNISTCPFDQPRNLNNRNYLLLMYIPAHDLHLSHLSVPLSLREFSTITKF